MAEKINGNGKDDRPGSGANEHVNNDLLSRATIAHCQDCSADGRKD